ncbi:MAG: hypothetical protein FWD65_07795 [Coriobacteriia bacterium]|nr:hypothetical protein [Coriobacteriia bacterium]
MCEQQKPIIPNPGSERDPKNFVGRKDTTKQAEDLLFAGQNILLSDPRRMGKTFWMRTFTRKQEAEGRFRVVFIDYQGVDSTEEFLTKTANALAACRSLPQKFFASLTALFDNMEVGVSKGPLSLKAAVRASKKTPITIMEDLLIQLDHDLAADNDDHAAVPLIIAMDEVADAVLSISENCGTHDAHNLLQRLRHLRNTTQNIHWIVAGSIGFHHIFSIIGTSSDTVNDLNTLKFGPLAYGDAKQLANRLALGIERPISPETVAHIVEITDAFPSVIQKLFDMMRYDAGRCSAAHALIEIPEATECFNDFINDRDQSRDVTHYVTRIKLYYAQNVDMAFRILDHIARGDEWTAFHDLESAIKTAFGDSFDREQFIATYNSLRDDHYLIARTSGNQTEVSWRYPLIKTIYQRRRELF